MATYGRLKDLSYTKAVEVIRRERRGPGEARPVPPRPDETSWFCTDCWRWHGAACGEG